MRLRLPDSGEQVTITVLYTIEEPQLANALRRWKRDPDHVPYHVTRVEMELTEGRCLKGRSECSPDDQFCRLEGRRLACNRLLSNLKSFSKNDRRAVFQKVCPSYFKKAKAPNGLSSVQQTQEAGGEASTAGG